MYRALIKPLLFRLSPARAHDLAFASLAPVEHIAPARAMMRAIFAPPRDARLHVRAMGIDFPTPIGLAAGFDKNALRPRALAALGFGHLELGTVTARAQAPNPPPNMFRLPADRALVNRLGFPNEGAERVATRLASRGAIGVPVGLSIGKSRDVPLDPIEPAIADYVASYRAVVRVADFVVVNVSSPNTKGLRAMQGADIARLLFRALLAERDASPKRVPLLVKIAPDLGDADLDALLEVVDDAKLDGVVATNTTIARPPKLALASDANEVTAIGDGGLSGPPLRARAREVVRRVRSRLGRKITVIGVGGVETADEAIALMRAGADLVQMYTGFIYEGPMAPARIARGMLREMERTGAGNVADLAAAT
jgi:dihydroorotate dehydrogenase